MALYERNSIHYSEEEKDDIVYVSYPCPEDGTHDYLALRNIYRVFLCVTNHKVFDLSTCSLEETMVHYGCDYHRPKDSSNIYICASIEDFTGNPSKIELQTFVDELAESIYDNKNIDEYKGVIEAKGNALLNLKDSYFNEKGVVLANSSYNVVGRILDKDDNVVGIINNFSTLQDNKDMIFSLNNCVSYLSLKDVESPTIEFTTGKINIVITDFDIFTSVEGVLRDYQIKINNSHIELSNKPIIAESISDINDHELFFDERADLLSAREKVFKTNDASNNVDTLFDDFDFDF